MKTWKKITFILMQQFIFSKIKNWYKLNGSLQLKFFTLSTLKSNSSNSSNDNNTLLTLDLILIKADKLFEEGKYYEAYEYLNQFKKYGHEIYWRLSRILYKVSCNKNITEAKKLSIIEEGLLQINRAFLYTNTNANLFKWKAILLYAKTEYISLAYKIQMLEIIKNNLVQAHKLDPHDYIVLYLLGHWCYQMASLTWFQRKIASVLYCDAPQSTYEESYYYFSKAEEIEPCRSITNAYMLGKVTYCLKQYYRARYYLKLAASLPVSRENESKMKFIATILAKKLRKYDIAKQIMK